jgi:hypothetical protein
MGEATRRKAEIEKLKSRESDWFARLSGDEKIVAEVAKAAFKKIVVERNMTGGCYNLAFFLREYLKREKGINVKMVVGWVTDDSWEGAISHAWIEYGGRKTDISLWHTEFPEHQLPGSVIIHDFDFRRGVTDYTYQRELPQSSRDYLDLASRNAEFGHQYKHKETEHLMIKGLAEKAGGATEYFSSAPTEMKYETLAEVLT